ncbi:MAG: ABC transporter transmembrane domain-containing protein [Alphaproteobacteria bacterium]|nr:ABC transporter transmembrane domain-containing protein [Alphaproteobacteria bacterium]
MDPTIFKFIWRYSRPQQIYVLLITVTSFPILYATLELPKIIINEAIGGQDFPKAVWGLELAQVPYLLVLCFAFLALVLVNGGLKYYINVYRGRLGERMLRRLRFELFSRVMRFPLPHFKRVSSGEIIPMITAEVEPVGGFIGDALALPAFQGGMLLVYLGFIFVQDPFLGLAAVALYPVQIVVIPKLQRHVNQLAKQRVRTVRMLSDRIGETVAGVGEIHANDASRLVRADIADRLGTIYNIRYKIFQRKFAIKFLNNFIAQLTPFFFYSIGGYFVIRGELSFGALVAVLAAYKDLASPWKELLTWYQIKEDVRIKYDQVVEQFAPEGMLKPELQDDQGEEVGPITGELAASNVSLSEDGRVTLVDGASFVVPLDQHIAIVGTGGSGKEELSQLIARLVMPTGGSVRLGDHNMADLPESVTGRRIAYVGSNSYVFSASVEDNLFLGLKYRPIRERELDDEERKQRQQAIDDAEVSGNITDDYRADWTDYEAAGVADLDSLQQRALEVLSLVDMDSDIYQMGLRGTVDPANRPELTERILEARRVMRERLADPQIAALIESFDEDRYNTNATLSENLLFGTPKDQRFAEDGLAENPYVLEILREAGLYDDLVQVGYQVADTMVELFSGLAPGHEFFEQFSFISSEDLPEYQLLLGHVSRAGLENLKDEDRARLLGLSFKLIPARHRLDLVTEELQARVIDARRRFAENLPASDADAIEFFSSDRYNAAGTLQDNILFGKLAYGQAQSAQRVGELISDVLDQLGLRPAVMEAGLDFQVGIAGSRLSAAQRQKLAIARAVLKRPDLLVLDEATTALDAASQSRVMDNLLREFKGKGIIWALHRANLASRFDRILVMRNGKVAEQGQYEELNRDGTALKELMQAE